MKFGCMFLFAAFLLMNFHASDAVICWGNVCSSCVHYTCKKLGETTRHGCPEDFFTDCSEHTEGVNFVKSKNYNDLEYNSFGNKVGYLSGCGKEVDGTACLTFKFFAMTKRITSGEKDFCYEAGKPCSNSNSQNSAFKLIGILLIGWMISALIY